VHLLNRSAAELSALTLNPPLMGRHVADEVVISVQKIVVIAVRHQAYYLRVSMRCLTVCRGSYLGSLPASS
jgi:hypothetical protein